jgi:hypothetical protein
MSTPNSSHLMAHSTITMAVAQQPKQTKSATKANANANANAASQKAAKVQMHRRSRTGWLDCFSFPVNFLVVAYDK